MSAKSATPLMTGPSAAEAQAASEAGRQTRMALLVWVAFFLLLVLFNGTIPFALGADLHGWTASPVKSVLFDLLFYAGMFLVVPLILIKGWHRVRQPTFLLPLSIAILGITLSHFFWPGVPIAIAAVAYLHWRFDLSGYGIRSRGWKGDLTAILLMGIMGLVPVLMRGTPSSFLPASAAGAALTRLFTNPASSFENLFYFGFLTERLSYRTKWLTPLLIGLMYTAHEMSNPEYWYGGMGFSLVFIGVALWAAIYLWRRSAAVIWLGDGLYRFVMALL